MEHTAAIHRVEITTTVKMDAVVSLETFVTIYKTAGWDKPVRPLYIRLSFLKTFGCCYSRIFYGENIDLTPIIFQRRLREWLGLMLST